VSLFERKRLENIFYLIQWIVKPLNMKKNVLNVKEDLETENALFSEIYKQKRR